MVIMAGMLPGVECARRRRLRQGAGADQSAAGGGGGTRRSSFCLYPAAGNGGAASSGKQQRSSGGGVMEMIHGWTLDSNAREAKERLDQKLRTNRDAAAIKRHHSTGSIKLLSSSSSSSSRPPPHRSAASGSAAADGAAAGESLAMPGVQREVYSSNKGVVRRLMRWSRPRWAAAEQAAECAVCLDEFRAGDVLAHLRCGHRFHWACALPWLHGTSRCPFCRAAVDAAAADSSNNPHATTAAGA